nr:MAG TPA: hypothetical protein [Caudoviricetes sp.]
MTKDLLQVLLVAIPLQLTEPLQRGLIHGEVYKII